MLVFGGRCQVIRIQTKCNCSPSKWEKQDVFRLQMHSVKIRLLKGFKFLNEVGQLFSAQLHCTAFWLFKGEVHPKVKQSGVTVSSPGKILSTKHFKSFAAKQHGSFNLNSWRKVKEPTNKIVHWFDETHPAWYYIKTSPRLIQWFRRIPEHDCAVKICGVSSDFLSERQVDNNWIFIFFGWTYPLIRLHLWVKWGRNLSHYWR